MYNKGYIGTQMSERAAAAYNNGKMPLSKWTKTALVEILDEYFKGKYDFTKIKKDVLLKNSCAVRNGIIPVPFLMKLIFMM